MKKSKTVFCFFIFIFTSITSANKDHLLSLLDSNSIETRSLAAQRIYGAGITDEKIYNKLEGLLSEVVSSLPKRSPRSDELAWHLKALSSSGDLKYLPLIEEFIKSKNRKVAKYAKKSKKELREVAANGKPKLHYSKVRVISDNQADKCTFLEQQTCETSRSPEKCIDHHKNKALQIEGNAILILHSDSSWGMGAAPWGKNTSMMASYYKCEGL